MYKEIPFCKKWIAFGGGWKRFGLGFSVDRYHVDIDLGFVWIAVEF